MKTITIHQPESFPWLGFFNKMMLADEYVILDRVQFRKNYFQNRNRFLTTQGPIYLSVPVGTKHDRTIRDVKITDGGRWRTKHLRTLIQAYEKAPYFHRYSSFFEELYNTPHCSLVDFNMTIIHFIREVLSISTPMVFSSELDVSGSNTELLRNICAARDADVYLSGKDGRNYLELELFRQRRIRVVYQDFRHPEYPQFNSKKFTPFMSTFDLLFNHSSESARQIVLSGGSLCEN